MKTLLPFAIACAVLLAACSGPGAAPRTDAAYNPLVAIEEGNNLANALANIIIQGNPLADEPGMAERLEREIASAKNTARIGQEERRRGRSGHFISVETDAEGEALYLENRLYFSPYFRTNLGPQLRVYLSTIVDAWDTPFPDPTALDLGAIKSAYGAQSYDVPRVDNPDHYRTVILWDAALERVHGFAQISR